MPFLDELQLLTMQARKDQEAALRQKEQVERCEGERKIRAHVQTVMAQVPSKMMVLAREGKGSISFYEDLYNRSSPMPSLHDHLRSLMGCFIDYCFDEYRGFGLGVVTCDDS